MTTDRSELCHYLVLSHLKATGEASSFFPLLHITMAHLYSSPNASVEGIFINLSLQQSNGLWWIE
jgi:hypothetical protein